MENLGESSERRGASAHCTPLSSVLPSVASADGISGRPNCKGVRPTGVEVVGVREQFGVFLDLAHYCGAIGDDDWWSLLGYPLDVLAARMASVYESLGTGQNEST